MLQQLDSANIFEFFPITLGELGLPPRVPPRPLAYQQPQYSADFEFALFAYDVFCRDGKTYIITPPNTDEAWHVALQSLALDGRPLAEFQHKIHKNKVHKAIIQHAGSRLTLNDREVQVKVFPSSYTNNHNILYTLSKDNEPIWLSEWINDFVAHHEIDTAVVYDNASTQYTTSELRTFLQSRCSNVSIYCVHCPGSWGPRSYHSVCRLTESSDPIFAEAWDSDFLQYAMLEHVRYALANADSCLVNADVDEIVHVQGDLPITTEARNFPGVSKYHGKWIEMETSSAKYSPEIRHSSHTLIDINSKCPTKWAANLRGLTDDVFLRVHDIAGPSSIYRLLTSALYLHHRQINNNWAHNRSMTVLHDETKHISPLHLNHLFELC
jgi:hypothetical protein